MRFMASASASCASTDSAPRDMAAEEKRAMIVSAGSTDSIGTGALNPVAARIMAKEIAAAVSRRFGITPFTTAVRTDYDSWTFLSRKHFGL